MTTTPSPRDRYLRTTGTVELTGVQALVRLPMDARRWDRSAGRATAAFISGYEGSPLGGYDLELARQTPLLEELDIVFRPGVNEELAATSVQGTQLASARPEKRFDGVSGFWYGKSPGLDRAADAIRHSNLGGTHPAGGVVALVGDDPAAKSSTVPGSSEALLADLGLPILYPSDPANALWLGMHAVEMSRASGLWVSLKIATNVADGTGQVDLDDFEFAPIRPEVILDGKPYRHDVTARLLQPALTGLEESRNGVRLEIARRYAAANGLNRLDGHGGHDRIGIVAGGKTFRDVRQALHTLGLDREERARGGLRLLDLRMIHPIEPGIIDAFAAGLTEIIVVEEKRSFIEAAIRDMLYGRPDAPLVTGKRYPDGTSAFPASGELEPDTIAPVLAARLRGYPGFETVKSWEADRRPRRDRRLLPLAVRTPYFCSGCPHNTSAKTPDGALVGAGIGCHALVLGMSAERVGEVTGLTQMGGEGAQWIGMAPFLDRPHLYQNLGDGTFHHSGSLAIRAAVAGGVNITYKLLYNSAVAMTGGQQAQGAMTIPEITRSLTAEGVSKIIVTTDSPKSYRRAGLAPGTRVYGRDRIVEAQEELAATPGVTVLIHDQECATELRRKRKRGLAADPAARVMINERVCEGCGDCGRKSNCLSVHPVDTEFGRKTRIDQSSCNKDYSCLDGDCPAFLTVVPGRRTKRSRDVVALADLPEPPEAPIAGHHTTRILGIGGSGVVTLSQILAAAANLADLQAVSLDQTGLAQKGGAVISDVKIGTDAESMASKAASQEVDLYLGADLLVAADPRNLTSTDPGRTVAVVSTSQVPTGRMAVDVTTRYPDTAALMDDIREATDADSAVFLDVRAASSQLFGDDQFANLILTGIACQLGALPLPAGSIERAIETNGVRVEENIQAFRRGRQYVANRGAFEAAVSTPSGPTLPTERPEIEDLVRRTSVDASSLLGTAVRRRVSELLAYQDHRYAARFADVIARVHRAESGSVPGSTALTSAVVQNLHKLMAYKDEYEVARLSLLPELEADIRAQFGDGATYVYRLHPPTLRAIGMKKKISLGPWFRFVYRALVGMRRLRGTSFDPFGRAEVRRVERALVGEYIDLIDAVLERLSRETIELAVQIAEAPDVIRGYEHVKLANVDRFRATIAVLLESYESRAGLMAREGRG